MLKYRGKLNPKHMKRHSLLGRDYIKIIYLMLPKFFFLSFLYIINIIVVVINITRHQYLIFFATDIKLLNFYF